MARIKRDLTQPPEVGPMLVDTFAGLALPPGYTMCTSPGAHRVRTLAGHVVCPGCDRLCRAPEGVGHDDEIRTAVFEHGVYE